MENSCPASAEQTDEPKEYLGEPRGKWDYAYFNVMIGVAVFILIVVFIANLFVS